MDHSCYSSRAAAASRPDSYNPQESASQNLKDIQDIIERVQRIQLVQEHRITELECQLESRHESRAQFVLFSHLPPELRCQIWELAIPSQVFRPFRYLEPSFLECKSLVPPVISRVCREARYVAHRRGALYCHEFLAPISWAWFDRQRDILDLSPYGLSENGFIPLQTRLLEQTEAIILDVGLVTGSLIAGLFGKSSQLGNVHTIYLMAGNPFLVEKQSWHPHAVARLFRDQSFTLVDLEDRQELEQLEQILEMSGTVEVSFMSKWHKDTIARLQAQIRPLDETMKVWKDAKQLLMEGWVSHNHGAPSLAKSFFHENGAIKEDQVRKAYPRLPTVKLVQTFEVAPVSQLAKWYKEGSCVMEDVRG
ncbi:hypothetical protein ACHAQJ_010615 [Trichoderma viride]